MVSFSLADCTFSRQVLEKVASCMSDGTSHSLIVSEWGTYVSVRAIAGKEERTISEVGKSLEGLQLSPCEGRHTNQKGRWTSWVQVKSTHG